MSLARSVEALEKKNFELEEQIDALHEALSQAMISLRKYDRAEAEWLEGHDWWPESHK